MSTENKIGLHVHPSKVALAVELMGDTALVYGDCAHAEEWYVVASANPDDLIGWVGNITGEKIGKGEMMPNSWQIIRAAIRDERYSAKSFAGVAQLQQAGRLFGELTRYGKLADEEEAMADFNTDEELRKALLTADAKKLSNQLGF